MATNDLTTLVPAKGAKHRRKRVGRGPGSGDGTTAGRGQKGQKSRSGGNIPSWFEGGQMPLQRRLPKRGFTSTRRQDTDIVNLNDIEGLGDVVDPELLIAKGRVPRRSTRIKVLGDGEITTAVTVKAHAFSKSARAKIEAAGGTVEEL